VSRAVAVELARWWDIAIWYPPVRDPWPVDLLTFGRLGAPQALEELASYDLVFYCMGNSLTFHQATYEASQQVPGVVVLHDVVLHNFFAGYYRGDRWERYLGELERWYGKEARVAAEAKLLATGSGYWEPHDVGRYPFFEPALRKARAVVTHSDYARSVVRKQFLGPVASLKLPFPKAEWRPRRRVALDLPPDRLVLLTMGHLNRNKRIDSVLEVLASHRELADQCVYVLAGPSDDDQRRTLGRLVEQAGLHECVRNLGQVSDDELAALLDRADVCINLRQPLTEAASGSLVEQMWYGKPVVVTDIGPYQELPDDCVVKTAPDDEVASLASALHRLTEDAGQRQQVGEAARQFARRYYQPSTYASDLVALVDDLRAGHPVLDLADQLGRRLASFGLTSTNPAVHSIARLATELFVPDGRRWSQDLGLPAESLNSR
jgi:glycosyltransferase involved in cell wall biosynthesis